MLCIKGQTFFPGNYIMRYYLSILIQNLSITSSNLDLSQPHLWNSEPHEVVYTAIHSRIIKSSLSYLERNRFARPPPRSFFVIKSILTQLIQQPSDLYKFARLIFEHFFQFSQLCSRQSLKKEATEPQGNCGQWNCDLKPTQQSCMREASTILVIHNFCTKKGLWHYKLYEV